MKNVILNIVSSTDECNKFINSLQMLLQIDMIILHDLYDKEFKS